MVVMQGRADRENVSYADNPIPLNTILAMQLDTRTQMENPQAPEGGQQQGS